MVEKKHKTETIAFRLNNDLLEKIDLIKKTENKEYSGIMRDAAIFYSELYPFLHTLKSKELYKNLCINEEVIKEEIYNALKKLI